MSAKAKYYLEYRYQGDVKWWRYEPMKDTQRFVVKVAKFQAENYPQIPNWRVRHKGRVIARWKDGKRVSK